MELKQKLESYEEKYKSMYDQVELEKSNSKAYQMNFQIKEIDNKINQLSKETKKYKNKYEQLKSKFNLIENVENKMNANQILKEELAKQKNLKMVYDSLKKENLNQIRLLNYIEGKNRNEEKILFLQNEVKGARSKLKAEQERYLKREKFLKLIHERIYSIENNLKNLNVKKKEIVSKEKNFTLEDLKNNLDKLMKLQGEINLKNEQNKSYSKNYKIKLHYNLCENKKLEDNYKALVGKQRILQQERNSTRNRILITEKKLGVGKSIININVNKRYSALESDFLNRNYYNPIKKNKSSIFPEYLEKLV